MREEPQDGAHVPQEVEEEAEDEPAPPEDGAELLLGEHAFNEIFADGRSSNSPFRVKDPV